MRILLVADIHSNWPALSAIPLACDACLCLGDLVDYATDPVPCIDWVKTHADAVVRGNHDHAVAQHIRPKGGSGLRQLAAATRPVHWELLNSARLKYLARLPITRHIELDGKQFQLLHATPRDPLDEYLAADVEQWRARLQGVEADFVCVGHSHVPFLLEVDGIKVVNPGSVGQPRDGDPRAAYAIIEDGQVSFHRVEYDIDATLAQMRSVGVEEPAVAFAEQVLRTGGKFE
jgi:putative phosphoesterase